MFRIILEGIGLIVLIGIILALWITLVPFQIIFLMPIMMVVIPIYLGIMLCRPNK